MLTCAVLLQHPGRRDSACGALNVNAALLTACAQLQCPSGGCRAESTCFT